MHVRGWLCSVGFFFFFFFFFLVGFLVLLVSPLFPPGALLSARVFVFPVWPHLAPELVWGSVFLALLLAFESLYS